MREENTMEITGIAVGAYSKADAVSGDCAINPVTPDKQEGRSSDGDWYVLQDELELVLEGANSEAVAIEVKFNPAAIVFAIGLLGTLVWSFIGNVGSGSNSAPLYHALTNEAIASANGFTAISPVTALIAICALAGLVGAVLGLVVVRLLGRKYSNT